jgi:hypothetical protein
LVLGSASGTGFSDVRTQYQNVERGTKNHATEGLINPIKDIDDKKLQTARPVAATLEDFELH